MAIATSTGVQNTKSPDSSRIFRDVDPVMRLLEPSATPLTTATAHMDKRQAAAPKFEWIESEIMPSITRMTANLADGVATALAVTAGTGSYFVVGDIGRIVETGENFLVTAVAANTLTITRGYGTVAGVLTTLATGDIIRVSNAAKEGADVGTINQTKDVGQFNYTQIFRKASGVTGTQAATTLYGGKEPKVERRKKAIEWKVDLENSFFFGQRKEDTSGGDVRRQTGGITDFVTTNVTSIGGALTQANFETFLQTGYRYGSADNKIFFCGPLIGAALSAFALARLAPPSPDITKWGVALKQYQSSQGDVVKVAVKRNWNDFQRVTGQMGTYGFLVDMDNVTWRYLEGRDFQLKSNRQNPGVDAEVEEYFAEGGWQISQERTHAIIKNVTS